MNSPAHYIVYGNDEALRGNDPAHCYECTSAMQALAVAYKHHVDPATHIVCHKETTHTVFFNGLDEICSDVLRNRATHFSIKVETFDGFTETVVLILNRHQLVSWILSHADELELFCYVFDYMTAQGCYKLSNMCETYTIQEYKNE